MEGWGSSMVQEYCINFSVYFDWAQRPIRRCHELAKTMAQEEEIKTMIGEFMFGIVFLDDFEIARKETLVSKEAYHLMSHMISTQDMNML